MKQKFRFCPIELIMLAGGVAFIGFSSEAQNNTADSLVQKLGQVQKVSEPKNCPTDQKTISKAKCVATVEQGFSVFGGVSEPVPTKVMDQIKAKLGELGYAIGGSGPVDAAISISVSKTSFDTLSVLGFPVNSSKALITIDYKMKDQSSSTTLSTDSGKRLNEKQAYTRMNELFLSLPYEIAQKVGQCPRKE